MLYETKQKKKEDKRTPNIEFLKESIKDNLESALASTTSTASLSEENDNGSSEVASESVEDVTEDKKLKEKTGTLKNIELTIEYNDRKLDEVNVIPEDSTAETVTNDTRVVKSIIKAEEYAPNFWDRLAQNEPINLKTEKEVTYGKGLQKNDYSNAGNAIHKRAEEVETGSVNIKFKSIAVDSDIIKEKSLVKV